MTNADMIWNRACMEKGGSNPHSGDRALAAMLGAHGLVMNGGVLHVVEVLNDQALAEAQSGYRYFEFNESANLLARAKDLLDADVDLETFERELDLEYARYIPSDSTLAERFEMHVERNPCEFAPL